MTERVRISKGVALYWKVNEVAAALQVSEQTIYRYVASGEIPYHKLNRAVRFKPSEIENWMETRKPETAKGGGSCEL